MASLCAALIGSDPILVRYFEPLNWSNDRTPGRLVRHLVDDLGNRQRESSKRIFFRGDQYRFFLGRLHFSLTGDCGATLR